MTVDIEKIILKILQLHSQFSATLIQLNAKENFNALLSNVESSHRQHESVTRPLKNSKKLHMFCMIVILIF